MSDLQIRRFFDTVFLMSVVFSCFQIAESET